MNDLDQHLKQLAIEAKRHPPKTIERQRSLTKLICEIQKSGRLIRRIDVPPQLEGSYQEIYAVATQRLFRYICEKIDNYDPNTGEVLQWANYLLKIRFSDASGEITGKRQHLSLDDLEIDEMNQETTQKDSLAQELRKYIEEDPEGLFSTAHTSGNEQANFKFISLRLADGYTYTEIAKELGIYYQTLNSFYKRTIVKFKPLFQEYLSK